MKEYATYIGKHANAFNKLDNDICTLIKCLNPINIQIPALIHKSVLEKIGYFNSFPHQIIGIKPLRQSIQYEDMLLTPSACLHFYPIFAQEKIDNGVFTTKARVFRNEEKNTDGETRLIDFTVREIVIVGTIDEVTNKLNYIGNLILDYAKKIGIEIELETASDPFYPSRENTIKRRLQLGNNQKREMIAIYNNKKLSIGSINYHGFHFSKTFGFDANNTIVTGCIGVGLERWMSILINTQKINNLVGKDCEI